MSNRKQLCVVFDIDETLIQFMPNRYKSLWDNMNPEVKNKYRSINFGSNVVILRPYIQEMFNYFKQTPNIKVGLWTYSEREYSEDIAGLLKKELGLPNNFFMFTWGAEDMESTEDGDNSGLAKDLTYVYRKFPNFNKFNTFLVDDVYKNLKHRVNIKNSVLIQPFAPFGTDKVRVDVGIEKQNEIANDSAFNELIKVCQQVLRDITNCDEEDINDAFTTEPVFTEKRLKRMKLDSLLKTYATNFIKMTTIGIPHQTPEFIMFDPQTSLHSGGMHKRYHYTRNKRRKSRKTSRLRSRGRI